MERKKMGKSLLLSNFKNSLKGLNYNLYISISSIVFLLLVSIQSYSQTAVIPDVNFRNKLLSDYPSLMTGNLLNIAAANAYTGGLNIPNANISDLSGIEHFTNIITLDAGKNSLQTIPSLASLTNLKFLYLRANQLTSLPDLSTNTALIQLHADSNQLTSLPTLSTLTNLTLILVTFNQLTSLPDLSSLINLQRLYVSNNPLNTLPDLSPNTALKVLHCDNNNLSQIIGLQNLPNLEDFNCWENNITDLSSLNNNTTLKIVWLFNNKLQTLPTLTNKPFLTTLLVKNNNLTFDQLLPLTTIPTLTTFTYANQDSTGVYSESNVRAKDTIVLEVLEDIAVTSNWYKWYKSGILLDSTQSTIFKIPNATQADNGTYKVEITNPNLPLLKLKHRPWKINILSCMDLVSYNFTIPTNQCSEGASAAFTNITLSGSTAPYKYYLSPLGHNELKQNYIPEFNNVPPGKYNFIIEDNTNCTSSVEVTIPKPKNCDPVITPNGDGQMDTYFIEDTGIAKIINLDGIVVKQLTTPAVWDGTKADGSPADSGYYAIVLNEKKYSNITIVK